MRILTTLLLINLSFAIYGQKNTVASGETISSPSGSISYSIGQIDYIYSTTGSGSYNHGVQQPIEFFNLGITNELDWNWSYYPNPATDIITISCGECDGDQELLIIDANGKEVLLHKWSTTQPSIDLTPLSTGTYFVHHKNQQNTIIKFIKH